MNSMKGMSQEEYLAKKAEAMRCEPIARMIPLGSISLQPNSMADGFVRIEGKSVSADETFFRYLSKLLNISGAMRRDLAGNAKEGKLDREGMFASMAEAMKMLKNTKTGGMNVTIIGDPSSNQLTGISDKKYSRIPNSNLFDVAESIMQRYPNILPVDVDVRGGGMGVNMSFVNNVDIGFGKSNGPDDGDESFNFGFTLNNGIVTSIGDFAYRLVCSNGMMRMVKNDIFRMKELTNKGIGDMFGTIAEMEKHRFIPVDYERNLRIADKTNASFGELEKMYDDVTSNLVSDDNDAINAHNRAEIARTFFRGLSVVHAKLASRNIDPRNLTSKQKQYIVTPQTMWEAINNLTWLGSHDTSYKWKNQRFMQKQAGMAFVKEYDLANLDLLQM